MASTSSLFPGECKFIGLCFGPISHRDYLDILAMVPTPKNCTYESPSDYKIAKGIYWNMSIYNMKSNDSSGRVNVTFAWFWLCSYIISVFLFVRRKACFKKKIHRIRRHSGHLTYPLLNNKNPSLRITVQMAHAITRTMQSFQQSHFV